MPVPQSSTRLTVAIIARDAEQPLDETLASIQTLADEVVVCDTGSQDQTVLVAQRYEARIVRHRWEHDFSAARNACLEHATSNWVLWLDAGEQLDSSAADELRYFIDHEADPQKAYMLLVRVPQHGKNVDAEQVGRVRLVPNRPELRFVGRVRETLVPALTECGLTLEGLPQVIYRGPREHDATLKQERARRNLVLADREIQQFGPQPAMLNCMAEALQALGERPRAAELFQHSIALSERGSQEMLEAYYGLLTALNEDETRREDQLTLCTQALEVYPLDAQLLCALGGYLQSLGRMELACRAYQTAFEHGTIMPDLWHLERIHEVAAICYSLTLQLEKRDEEAEQVLQQAIDLGWASHRLQRHLLDLYIKRERRDEAVALAAQLAGRSAPLRIAVRGACLAAARNWTAARSYLDAAYNAGCRDSIVFRWLSATLLAIGENETARRLLQQWTVLEPDHPELAKLKMAAGLPTLKGDKALRVDTADTPARHSMGAGILRRSNEPV